jgi:hypothetical protein
MHQNTAMVGLILAVLLRLLLRQVIGRSPSAVVAAEPLSKRNAALSGSWPSLGCAPTVTDPLDSSTALSPAMTRTGRTLLGSRDH